jgi:enoyl-[acyl-carrier protein] reductase II
MGTRFLASLESPAHDSYKELVVEADDRGTVITGRAFGPVRVIKNTLAERILQAESEGRSTEEILELIGPGRTMKAAMEGDLEEGSFMCGQICGMIGELKSAAEIIREMMEGYDEVAGTLL